MADKIFINIPVKDLNKSMEFFKKLGFTFNPQFTDETAACLVLGENIFSMLVTEEKFKVFSKKELPDTSKTSEVLIAIDAKSRDEVDTIIKKAVDAGGSLFRDTEDYGWMYGTAFRDLDGHIWEVYYMDENAIPENPSQSEQVKSN